MLEIQGHLFEATDKGLFTSIYSVDMSAPFAFDLKDSLDPGMLWTLWYASLVRYDTLLKKDKLIMDTLHYQVLRVAVKDWGRLYPRYMLDTLDRALPNTFAKYAFGLVIMTSMATKYPQRLYNTIMENHFTTKFTEFTATIL